MPNEMGHPELGRLRRFVTDLASLLERQPDEPVIAAEGQRLLGELVAHDDWLPAEFAEHDPARYTQYLLHCDSAERFSIVSFVWGPGQCTPVHDHGGTWGLVGILRGAEQVQRFIRRDGSLLPDGDPQRLEQGAVDFLSPSHGDIHKVSNALVHAPSVSIHVYGANVGALRRTSFDEAGNPKLFISGYANDRLPNIWEGALN